MMTVPRFARAAAGFAVVVALTSSAARAQDAPAGHQHDMTMPMASGWTWSPDAAVFFGYNYQQRKFTDFDSWESQNWFGLVGEHPMGAGIFAFDVMLSLEPFTLPDPGSPQVFQVGEIFQGRPIIDHQHPHDLFMGLGTHYRVPKGRVTFLFDADVVGSPALGPTVYMHRASGRDNPQSPLIHHYTDSTHITAGVLTAGITASEITLEASWFRGEEPDDNRTDIDTLKLDSWSGQIGWRRGPWYAQFSGAHLHRPEALEPYDMTRLTASVEYEGSIGSHRFAATALWGENREVHGILDGYLFEWDLHTTAHGMTYGRVESLARDLLDLGSDPPGFIEPHRISHVVALTGGYVHDFLQRKWGRLGLGGDITIYSISDNLVDSYGSPRSFHVFVRYRPLESAGAPHAHMH
jgi:hypothetical protein